MLRVTDYRTNNNLEEWHFKILIENNTTRQLYCFIILKIRKVVGREALNKQVTVENLKTDSKLEVGAQHALPKKRTYLECGCYILDKTNLSMAYHHQKLAKNNMLSDWLIIINTQLVVHIWPMHFNFMIYQWAFFLSYFIMLNKFIIFAWDAFMLLG